MELPNGLSPSSFLLVKSKAWDKVYGYWFKIHTINHFSVGFPPNLGDYNKDFRALPFLMLRSSNWTMEPKRFRVSLGFSSFTGDSN